MEPVNNFVNVSTNGQDIQSSISEDKITTYSSSVKEVHRCPYKDCSFSSTWKASLNNHIKTHTDERPWECALCNKHFRLKHHLKHHILTHSQNKPFKCNLCEYRSNDIQSLQRHKVNKHKFPMKRKAVSKALSLPTMVSLSSQAQLNSSPFMNSLLPRSQEAESFLHSQLLPHTAPPQQTSLPSNSLSSISDALMKRQQFLLSTENDKIPGKSAAATDGAGVFLPHNMLNVEGDPSHQADDNEAANDHHSVVSVQSMYAASKEGKSQSDLKPTFWTVSTPNSHKSTDVVANGRTSVDSLNTKSPSSSNSKQYSECFTEHFSVFEPSEESEKPAPDDSTSVKRRRPESETKSLPWKCSHCAIVFPDNIMYGLHMGCHAVGNPFQCNVCGKKCSDRHDFMFHFTIGKHVF